MMGESSGRGLSDEERVANRWLLYSIYRDASDYPMWARAEPKKNQRALEAELGRPILLFEHLPMMSLRYNGGETRRYVESGITD